MGEPNLFMICVAAFCAVFVLLAFLALAMRILINVFPERITDELDEAVLAAVSVSMSTLYPGTRITKVEQMR